MMQEKSVNLLVKGRDKGIETLRGMAIILMVAGHVIGPNHETGLKVEEESWFRYFYYFFEYLRMPLFTVISGFVYAMKPISTIEGQKKFLNRKVFRLLIPFFFAITLFCVFQAIVPGTNAKLSLSEFWRPYFFPYAQFWFVQGMFIVFIIISFLETFKVMQNIKGWLVVFLCSMILFYTDPINIAFFSLYKVPFLFMFFCFGLGMRRFYSQLFHNNRLIYVMSLTFILSFTYQQYIYFEGSFDTRSIVTWLTIIVGLSGAFVLIMRRFYNKELTWIGNYSYEIFLYHAFGTAGGRIFLKLLGVHNLTIYFVFSLTLGIALPIFFRLLCDKVPVITTVLFGERLKKADLSKEIKGAVTI